MAEVGSAQSAQSPAGTEAPDAVIAVHGDDGTPVAAFVCCDSATSPARRRAIADPVNALALAAPRLLKNPTPRALNGHHTVQNLADFKARFKQLTGGSFDVLSPDDWKNCIVAGGAVVTALSPDQRDTSPNTDVDLFLYGLDEAAARAKLERLFDVFKAGSPTALALRTPHTVTIVLPAPKRIVQIVLNLHAAADDVVNAFDVDVCGCYYDGQRVSATRRCARAFATRVNLAVPSRRSYTFETRLIKYAKRGFEIGVPNLKPDEVQLKKRIAVKTCVRDLPKTDPRYEANGWKRVDTGHEYKFDGGDDSGYGYGYGREADEPGMFDYMNAKGCRKLLIADLAGRSQFKSEGRRTKFIFNARDTSAIAEFLMATSDPYGPSLPDVPGSRNYHVGPDMKTFTRNAALRQKATFVVGPIKTGADAGFDEATWFDQCYIPMTD